jgi:hypothetical protein
MDNEFWDEDERKEYEQGYSRKMRWLADDLGDPDDAGEILSEMMKSHNVRHSKNPESDAELNFIKAKEKVAQRNKLNGASESYVDFIARSRGISKVEARKWAKSALKGGR